MLKFEFKRSIGNRIFLYLFIITGIIFLMGWILPVGIDHAKEILLHEYLFSTYTVFTQFGFLFFSFGAVYYINRDYNQKNIMFYKMFNSNSLTCYLRKILVLFVEEVTCIVFFVFIVSVLYKSTNHVVTAGLLYILVSLYFLLISGVFARLIRNMITAMGMCIAFWISTLILVNIGGVFKNLAIFDASNTLYKNVEKYFHVFNSTISNITWQYICVNLIITVVICVLVVIAIKKKWMNNGL